LTAQRIITGHRDGPMTALKERATGFENFYSVIVVTVIGHICDE
jgi:hypothetical protein